jgi:hypothetical protein
MVMRNGNDEADARRWWDDLPPRVRARVSHPPAVEPAPERPSDPPPAPLFTAGELVRDLARLALLFFAIAVANMLFLFLVLSFLHSG